MHPSLRMKGLVAAGALLASGLGSSAIFATRGAAASPARAAATTTSTTSAITTRDGIPARHRDVELLLY